jgi:hypothetical protein
MIIDCHAHLVPQSLFDAIQAAKANFPSVKLIEEGGSLGFAFAGNKPTRPVSKPLSDMAARLQWLDTNKIERQVVGGWLDMFAYQIPAEESPRWSRLINRHLAKAGKGRAALHSVGDGPAAGWCACRRGAEGSACRGFQRRHDRYPAEGQRRRAG